MFMRCKSFSDPTGLFDLTRPEVTHTELKHKFIPHLSHRQRQKHSGTAHFGPFQSNYLGETGPS